MIILYHNFKEVISVFDAKKNQELEIPSININDTFIQLSKVNPDRIIVWCLDENKGFVNLEYIASEFLQTNKMFSFSENNFMSKRIGYIEESPFLKVNKTVKYPTWLMSSLCGAIHSATILNLQTVIKTNNIFAYNLNAIAKLGMPNGLFCYSAPSLLLENAPVHLEREISTNDLFKFVKQHFKFIWTFLLFLNCFIYEKKFFIAPFILSFFEKNRTLKNTFKSETNTLLSIQKESYDVIIPTLGRKMFLYDVLMDLSNQTLLPSSVIIIEQNGNEDSISELDYIKTETFPFIIKHQFTHQTGACNARNLALNEVDSNYVFFADDDIRFENNSLSKSIDFMINNNFEAITLSCKREGDTENVITPLQWTSFGSGCSIVKKSVLKNVKFNLAFEHGFGEDSDFGAQLRNNGTDIIYFPDITIKHLKAPIGGFRTKHQHPWEMETIKPKPSPTVLLSKLLNDTEQQVFGYKTILFFKYYKYQKIKNPWNYFKYFKKQWASSLYWVNTLKERSNI